MALAIVIITFLVVSAVLHVSAQSAIKVGVYYETLCPDSQRFITRQLVPLMENGGMKAIDLQFIPYGKARTVKQRDIYKFSCQHGKAECEGNKMHSCAIKYITNANEILEFVACSMAASDPPNSLNECSRKAGVSGATVSKIKTCSDSIEGDELLAANGELTSALRPRLSFVPTVTYNDVYDYNKMMASQNNFKGIVCAELKNEAEFCPQPKSTENRGERKVRSYANDEY